MLLLIVVLALALVALWWLVVRWSPSAPQPGHATRTPSAPQAQRDNATLPTVPRDESRAPDGRIPLPQDDLHLPGRLPKLDATIAPPLHDAPPPPRPPPLTKVEIAGQVSESDARLVGDVIWPHVQACMAQHGPWPHELTVHLGLAGGLLPGRSPLYEPHVTTPGVPTALQRCVQEALRKVEAGTATDTNGSVQLTFTP